MAGFDIKANLFADLTKWSGNMKKASNQTESFGKSVKKVSGAVKAAWAGVAALGVGVLYDAIIDVTKAAAEERKSIALLNGALDKNWKATDKTKEAVADFITQQQNLSGILDDKLRPAFAKIALVVKKPEKAMKAFSLAMDVSAGTGKDLNIVSQAMAKFLGGNKSALDKLVPGLKDAGDKMAFLQSKYAGMAAVAGSNDPFARINVVMEDFKEKLGTAFLPVIDKFATWLASDEAQQALDDLASKVQEFGDWFMSPEGQKTFDGWMKDLKALIKLAGDFLGLVGDVANLLDSKNKATNGQGAIGAVAKAYKSTPFAQETIAGQNAILGRTGSMSLAPVINLQVNTNPITGDAVAKLLKGTAQKRGITVGKMIGG